MDFEIIGEITNIKTIAVGSSIREIARLRKVYGAGRWRKLKGTAIIQFSDGTMCTAEIHWYEAHGIGKRNSKSNISWKSKMAQHSSTQYALCVKNEGYPASLELRKIYEVVPDTHAAKHRQIRIIDESGEDYLYPAENFIVLELPDAAEKALSAAS